MILIGVGSAKLPAFAGGPIELVGVNQVRYSTLSIGASPVVTIHYLAPGGTSGFAPYIIQSFMTGLILM